MKLKVQVFILFTIISFFNAFAMFSYDKQFINIVMVCNILVWMRAAFAQLGDVQ